MFVQDVEGKLLQLEWREDREELKLIHRIQTGVKIAWEMCYMEQSNILFITSKQDIKAINPETGSVLWEFTLDAEDKSLDPRRVCHDLDGRIYVADGENKRLILLNGETGELMQVLVKDEKIGWIFEACWTNTAPQLTVHHGGSRISTYNVAEE